MAGSITLGRAGHVTGQDVQDFFVATPGLTQISSSFLVVGSQSCRGLWRPLRLLS